MTTRTSLRLPPDLPLANWKRVGEQIFLIANSSTWWLGDWLVFGEERYPDRYQRAIKETQLDYGTLRNYAWVARKFDVTRRHDALSFNHHREVASLPADEQDLWLKRAEELGWSKNKLRLELRAHRRSVTQSQHDPDVDLQNLVHVQMKIPLDEEKLWQEAAQRADCDLLGWIFNALNNAARSQLSLDEPGE